MFAQQETVGAVQVPGPFKDSVLSWLWATSIPTPNPPTPPGRLLAGRSLLCACRLADWSGASSMEHDWTASSRSKERLPQSSSIKGLRLWNKHIRNTTLCTHLLFACCLSLLCLESAWEESYITDFCLRHIVWLCNFRSALHLRVDFCLDYEHIKSTNSHLRVRVRCL